MLVALMVVATGVAHSQVNAPGALSAVAQEALNKGILAARVPDYLLAIRYFEEARKIAPLAPVVFLNLGLAESRVPSRELRAMAWFGAYLSAYPDAPNAAAVKEQIALLEVRNQSNVGRLIKSVQDAASQVSSDKQGANLRVVATLLAEVGDIAAALRIVDIIQSAIYKGYAQRTIAEAQAAAGDFPGAQKTASLITRPDYKIEAQLAIVEAQAKSGDIAGAQKTAESIPEEGGKRGAQSAAHSAIAEAQAKNGDVAGARRTAGLIQSAYWKSVAKSYIGEAQTKGGDSASAQKTFVEALETADLIQDASNKSRAQARIAEAQAKSGDIAGAQKTADLVQEAWYKRYAQTHIAEAQSKSGDLAGAKKTFVEALKTADLIQSASHRGDAQRAILDAQAKAGLANAPNSSRQSTSDSQLPSQRIVTVSDWLLKLDNDGSYDSPLNTGPFLDLAGYLKSLPPSDNPQTVFDSLRGTTEKLVRALNVISGMLKQQGRK